MTLTGDKDLDLYILCFVFSVGAAVVRQKAFGGPMEPMQVMWSSLHSGFTSLAASICALKYLKIDRPLVVSFAIAMGLMGKEAYNIMISVFTNYLRTVIPVVPTKGDGDDANPGGVGGGGAPAPGGGGDGGDGPRRNL